MVSHKEREYCKKAREIKSGLHVEIRRRSHHDIATSMDAGNVRRIKGEVRRLGYLPETRHTWANW